MCDRPGAGLKLCLLHWQADSLHLSQQGNPISGFFKSITSNNLAILSQKIEESNNFAGAKLSTFHVAFFFLQSLSITQDEMTHVLSQPSSRLVVSRP